jgi:hypothetical protein
MAQARRPGAARRRRPWFGNPTAAPAAAQRSKSSCSPLRNPLTDIPNAARPTLPAPSTAACSWGGQMDEVEGELACGVTNDRAATLYLAGPRTQTMMRSCASGSEAAKRRLILLNAIEAVEGHGTPPPRTVIGDPIASIEDRPETVRCTFGAPLNVQDAGRPLLTP